MKQEAYQELVQLKFHRVLGHMKPTLPIQHILLSIPNLRQFYPNTQMLFQIEKDSKSLLDFLIRPGNVKPYRRERWNGKKVIMFVFGTASVDENSVAGVQFPSWVFKIGLLSFFKLNIGTDLKNEIASLTILRTLTNAIINKLFTNLSLILIVFFKCSFVLLLSVIVRGLCFGLLCLTLFCELLLQFLFLSGIKQTNFYDWICFKSIKLYHHVFHTQYTTGTIRFLVVFLSLCVQLPFFIYDYVSTRSVNMEEEMRFYEKIGREQKNVVGVPNNFWWKDQNGIIFLFLRMYVNTVQ